MSAPTSSKTKGVKAICWVSWREGLRVNAGEVLVDPAPVLGHPVQAVSERRGPSRRPVRRSRHAGREALEDAVYHHHRDEGLGPLVEHGRILRAQVLAAAHPVTRRRRGRCWPRPWRAVGASRRHEGQRERPLAARRSQKGSNSTWPGDFSPHGRCGTQIALRPESEREVEFGQGEIGLVERNDGHAKQTRIVARKRRSCGDCGPARRRSAVAARSSSWARTAWPPNGWRTPAGA